jgi:signal transduction histidine kinase
VRKGDSVAVDQEQIGGLLAALTQSLPARIWIKNSELAYVHVNARLADDFGIPREKWIGATDETLFPQLARASRRNDLAALSSGRPLQTTDLVVRDGRTEYAFVLRFPLEIEAQRYLGALAIDLTNEISGLVELHRVQEQRFNTERLRALGEQATGLAHDLNNSLNVVSLRLDVVRARADAGMLGEIDAVRRSIGAAVARVKEVQNFARAGRNDQLRPIDLCLLVRDAIELVDLVLRAPTVLGGRITIDCDFPESLPMISGLANELKHVFANLLLNARDAMPEGGTIKLTEGRSDHQCSHIRRGPRHSGGESGQDLRSVFHHQAHRQRIGSVDGQRRDETNRRRSQRAQSIPGRRRVRTPLSDR